ncbi:MarR family winged helix-turn-helix transcriptional regulator [Phytoactinopolyspora mesophila]|uniref:MarR family transcriptional regulator n=1 Tax=Phytoactinopolyspora mesophila TaxID=2650750 RepID=A0A7K3MAE4_9ACTN|nr:MarR family transcriptional regulator [Phytoactinopolyspora mesophila]NDL60279.1 MarR family transcriptional regulator [Phytoactinopolyspora mesophila]
MCNESSSGVRILAVVQTREHQLVEQWRELLASYNEIAIALDRDLQDRHGIGLSEFEALDRLVDSGDEKLRMLDLASGMYLSQSALSRAVARLERAGLVERAMCADDRRGIFVKLTVAGRAKHAEASATHRQVLAAHLR